MPIPRRAFRLVPFLVLAGLTVCATTRAANPYLDVPALGTMTTTPAYRYANASNDEIRTWLAERELPFAELTEPASGVRLAGRLQGPLHGVAVHGTDPAHSETSPYDIIDGRLALALDDFCRLLSEAHVVELLHYTIYRPSQKVVADDEKLTRHGGAMAIDVGALKLDDGTWIRVKRDWSPSVGAKTCGPGERVPTTEFGRRLHDWVCEARKLGIFHYALTPHFDAAHADHLHLEIKPGVKWFLYN
jgi:hypothetical protein